MRKKTVWIICLLIISLVILAGCRENTTVNEDEFTIVTSFYPMYVATINVAKDIPGVRVLNMTKVQTGCLHDYQLTPEDLKVLELADAFVINGAGMEAFMSEVIGQQQNLKIIEASLGIPLMKDASGADNPHVWVSITNAISQIDNIAEQLQTADPGHADAYAQNAKAYKLKLEAVKEKMHLELDDLNQKDIVTFHEAFPYFAREFGFNIIAVIEREPGTAPSPRELVDTIDLVNKSGVRALFVEPQYPAKAAETIAQETGSLIYELDPGVTGIARADGFDDYIKVMENNLSVLKEALK